MIQRHPNRKGRASVLVIAPPSQELEPPSNTDDFNGNDPSSPKRPLNHASIIKSQTRGSRRSSQKLRYQRSRRCRCQRLQPDSEMTLITRLPSTKVFAVAILSVALNPRCHMHPDPLRAPLILCCSDER